MPDERYDAVVIGSGFGGTVATTALAEAGAKVLILERGTWWLTPEGPAIPPDPPPQGHLRAWLERNRHPLQYWPRPNDAKGMVFLWNSIYKRSLGASDDDLGPRTNRSGLYRYTRFEHNRGNVDVVSASGVGGGSLVYSGVNLIPEQEVLTRIGLNLSEADFREAAIWMARNRGRINKIVTKIPVPHRDDSDNPDAFQLPPRPSVPPPPTHHEAPDPRIPSHEEPYLLLDRARVLKRARQAALDHGHFPGNAEVGDWRPLPLSVVEYDPRPSGEHGNSDRDNTFCLRQGRCMLGCIPAARHTLNKSLYKLWDRDDDPKVMLFPKAEVQYIDRAETGGGYRIYYKDFWGSDGNEKSILADKVSLSAGTLGTTELLLRSRRRGTVPFSDRLGEKFSTNGDFFGFATNASRFGRVNPTFGPINVSGFHIVFDRNTDSRTDLHIEDCGIPPMLAEFTEQAVRLFDVYPRLRSFALGVGNDLIQNSEPFPSLFNDPATTDPNSYPTPEAMLANTFFFHGMGAGPGEPFGRFTLTASDRLNLELSSDLAAWDVFAKLDQSFRILSDQMGGTYKPPPLLQHENRITVVHPLGGCPIGRDRSEGVVDEFGRVFDASAGDPAATLPGLFVVDGAAIPGALAVNPTLTIVAHAIKAVGQALTEVGYKGSRSARAKSP